METLRNILPEIIAVIILLFLLGCTTFEYKPNMTFTTTPEYPDYYKAREQTAYEI